MKIVTMVGMTLFLGMMLQGCSTEGTQYQYDASQYDKEYQKYKLEKEMQEDIQKNYSKEELQDLEKNLKKKYK